MGDRLLALTLSAGCFGFCWWTLQLMLGLPEAVVDGWSTFMSILFFILLAALLIGSLIFGLGALGVVFGSGDLAEEEEEKEEREPLSDAERMRRILAGDPNMPYTLWQASDISEDEKWHQEYVQNWEHSRKMKPVLPVVHRTRDVLGVSPREDRIYWGKRVWFGDARRG